MGLERGSEADTRQGEWREGGVMDGGSELWGERAGESRVGVGMEYIYIFYKTFAYPRM